MNRPIINIITRTTNESYFKICYDSIKQQTYPNYALIVGSDHLPCDYYDKCISLKLGELEYPQPQPSTYPALWNRHCETLAKYVVPGWVQYLDCDDCYSSPASLQTIIDNIDNEDQLLIWRVIITSDFIVPRLEDFGQIIAPGNISGIGIAFHTKWLPVKWSTWSYGDFRVCRELLQRGIQPKFINQILTECQNGPHHGTI